jgi:hypothetical protein
MPLESTGRNNTCHLGLKASTGGNHQTTLSCVTREGHSPSEICRRHSKAPKIERTVAHEIDRD